MKIRLPAVTIVLLVCLSGGSLRAESRVREGSPRVKLVSFSLQTEIVQGEFVKASAFFQLTAPMEEDAKVFFHLAVPGQANPAVNLDFSPWFPTSRWMVGQTVEAGPIGLAIPSAIAPGDYDVRLGLFTTQRTQERVVYLREPFINPEISDFVVRRVTIAAPPEGETPKVERPLEMVMTSFESETDIMLWEPVGTRISPASIEEIPAVKVTAIDAPGVEYPGIELANFFGIYPEFSDWSEYDALQCRLAAGAAGSPGRILLQIGDQSGRHFKDEIRFETGRPRDYLLPMVDLGGQIDISRISRIKFFFPGRSRDVSFLLGGLRIVARAFGDTTPAVKFSRLEAPGTVRRGEPFVVKISFILDKPVFAPCKLFVHVYRENDRQGAVNVSSNLPVPIRSWPLGEEVAVQSAPLLIRGDSPPGTYVIRAGLFTAIESSGEGYVKYATWDDGRGQPVLNITQPVAGTDYIKQPYANPEIRDWEVGRFTVLD